MRELSFSAFASERFKTGSEGLDKKRWPNTPSLRTAYQDQQIDGLMRLQELVVRLEELEEVSGVAERKLMALKAHQQRVVELER